MSIFARPHSPPPRAISPSLPPLNPLPLPPARTRNPSLRKTPSRGILKPTPPSSPSAPIFPSSTHTHTLTHRRSIQFAVPYRSPPASPTLASPPPPVPPIPAFALDVPDQTSPPGSSTLPACPTRALKQEQSDGPASPMSPLQFMSTRRGLQPVYGRRTGA
ncbi:hypothetical protein D9757_002678 [Collybiopsis confluens]|uniref:Uncharacterized protein n=1 Tax=Collybiopsis confluens TaxID=2823264 RepID=A0A8H5HWL8_9AGAR|nr:hypothetical protein D9757_002678 [Collybiopsis confluens]